jgi:hypothetical protein
MQPNVGAIHKPDNKEDETTSVTNEVIASLLSKLAENSSGGSASLFLSAIEQTPIMEQNIIPDILVNVKSNSSCNNVQ